VNKLFPEGVGDEPGAEPGTAKQPEPGGEGGTIDLSQAPSGGAPGETPEQKQQREADETTEAQAAGMTVAEYREAHAAEKGRTDAIAAKTGETLEEIYRREEAEGKPTDLEAAGKPAKTFTQDEVESTVQKRVKKLARENEDLKQQLAARPTAATPDTFEATETATQSGIDRVDDLFDLMRDEPQKVEAELRKMLGTNAPAEMTPEYMRGVLRRTKRGLEGQLADVAAQRQKFTTERQSVEKLLAEPEMAKAVPFIADEDSEEHAVWQTLRKSPQLKNHPRGDYLAVAVLLGIRQLTPTIRQIADRQAGKKPAAGATVKLKIRSKMPGTGSPGGRGSDATGLAAKVRGMKTSDDAADVVAEVFGHGRR
jgi:hypothetical protein